MGQKRNKPVTINMDKRGLEWLSTWKLQNLNCLNSEDYRYKFKAFLLHNVGIHKPVLQYMSMTTFHCHSANFYNFSFVLLQCRLLALYLEDKR